MNFIQGLLVTWFVILKIIDFIIQCKKQIKTINKLKLRLHRIIRSISKYNSLKVIKLSHFVFLIVFREIILLINLKIVWICKMDKL